MQMRLHRLRNGTRLLSRMIQVQRPACSGPSEQDTLALGERTGVSLFVRRLARRLMKLHRVHHKEGIEWEPREGARARESRKLAR